LTLSCSHHVTRDLRRLITGKPDPAIFLALPYNGRGCELGQLGMAAAPRPAGVRRRAGTGQNAQPQRSASWPTDQRRTCRLVRYRRYTRDERRPRWCGRGLQGNIPIEGSRCPRRPRYYPKATNQARIATALPMGSRKTLHPADNRHCASSAKNRYEKRVAATPTQGQNQDPELFDHWRRP
jgi:hypothetical protein